MRHPEKPIIAISKVVQDRLLQKMTTPSRTKGESVSELLSDRELVVLMAIGEGLTTQEIADKLHLSPKTIQTYRDRIKEKLQIDNASELIRYAVHWVSGKTESE